MPSINIHDKTESTASSTSIASYSNEWSTAKIRFQPLHLAPSSKIWLGNPFLYNFKQVFTVPPLIKILLSLLILLALMCPCTQGPNWFYAGKVKLKQILALIFVFSCPGVKWRNKYLNASVFLFSSVKIKKQISDQSVFCFLFLQRKIKITKIKCLFSAISWSLRCSRAILR